MILGSTGWKAAGGRPAAHFRTRRSVLRASSHTQLLNDLHDEHDEQHADPDDVLMRPLMPPDDGNAAKSAAADGRRHGGVAQHGHGRDDGAHDERGLCLRDHDLADDAKVRGAHGLRRFNDAGADLLERGLHHAGNVGGGGNDQHHDHGGVADAGADDDLCHRQHGDHQHDERDRAENIHDNAQRTVQPAHRSDAALAGHGKHNAQRQSDYIGDQRGQEGHVHGFPDAPAQRSGLPKLFQNIRHTHTSRL